MAEAKRSAFAEIKTRKGSSFGGQMGHRVWDRGELEPRKAHSADELSVIEGELFVDTEMKRDLIQSDASEIPKSEDIGKENEKVAEENIRDSVNSDESEIHKGKDKSKDNGKLKVAEEKMKIVNDKTKDSDDLPEDTERKETDAISDSKEVVNVSSRKEDMNPEKNDIGQEKEEVQMVLKITEDCENDIEQFHNNKNDIVRVKPKPVKSKIGHKNETFGRGKKVKKGYEGVKGNTAIADLTKEKRNITDLTTGKDLSKNIGNPKLDSERRRGSRERMDKPAAKLDTGSRRSSREKMDKPAAKLDTGSRRGSREKMDKPAAKLDTYSRRGSKEKMDKPAAKLDTGSRCGSREKMDKPAAKLDTYSRRDSREKMDKPADVKATFGYRKETRLKDQKEKSKSAKDEVKKLPVKKSQSSTDITVTDSSKSVKGKAEPKKVPKDMTSQKKVVTDKGSGIKAPSPSSKGASNSEGKRKTTKDKGRSIPVRGSGAKEKTAAKKGEKTRVANTCKDEGKEQNHGVESVKAEQIVVKTTESDAKKASDIDSGNHKQEFDENVTDIIVLDNTDLSIKMDSKRYDTSDNVNEKGEDIQERIGNIEVDLNTGLTEFSEISDNLAASNDLGNTESIERTENIYFGTVNVHDNENDGQKIIGIDVENRDLRESSKDPVGVITELFIGEANDPIETSEFKSLESIGIDEDNRDSQEGYKNHNNVLKELCIVEKGDLIEPPEFQSLDTGKTSFLAKGVEENQEEIIYIIHDRELAEPESVEKNENIDGDLKDHLDQGKAKVFDKTEQLEIHEEELKVYMETETDTLKENENKHVVYSDKTSITTLPNQTFKPISIVHDQLSCDVILHITEDANEEEKKGKLKAETELQESSLDIGKEVTMVQKDVKSGIPVRSLSKGLSLISLNSSLSSGSALERVSLSRSQSVIDFLRNSSFTSIEEEPYEESKHTGIKLYISESDSEDESHYSELKVDAERDKFDTSDGFPVLPKKTYLDDDRKPDNTQIGKWYLDSRDSSVEKEHIDIRKAKAETGNDLKYIKDNLDSSWRKNIPLDQAAATVQPYDVVELDNAKYMNEGNDNVKVEVTIEVDESSIEDEEVKTIMESCEELDKGYLRAASTGMLERPQSENEGRYFRRMRREGNYEEIGRKRSRSIDNAALQHFDFARYGISVGHRMPAGNALCCVFIIDISN